ncbi:hypothetical protein QYF61_021961 [Mycteria americana]|uniref:Uncharacterized protein n=1 Tax=Mycteria americana TaxID=33587 RepID=A0AAN7NVG0_MYCAM|nr:hypothetical protein QYF61_021961 [Mycteria americana]
MGGNEEERHRFFSVVTRTRGNGHKLKHMKFHLNTRQHFFYCEGDQTLAQVAQRGCEVSVCGDIYTRVFQHLSYHLPDGSHTERHILENASQVEEIEKECFARELRAPCHSFIPNSSTSSPISGARDGE